MSLFLNHGFELRNLRICLLLQGFDHSKQQGQSIIDLGYFFAQLQGSCLKLLDWVDFFNFFSLFCVPFAIFPRMKKPENIGIRVNRCGDKNCVFSEGMGSWSQLNLFFKPRNLFGYILEGNLKFF